MLKRYIIDSSFEFWPETYQLVVFGAENFTLTLNAPASRCLELLIEQRFNLVPQHDFYEYVWGKEGKSVSVNTLYQNIGLLRKALKSISKEYEVMVLTVPKQGFKFNQIFLVEERNDRGIVPPVSNNDAQVAVAAVEPLPKAMAEPPATTSWWSRFKWPIAMISALLVLAFASAILYLAAEKEVSSPLNSYSLFAEESGCTTYANSNIHDISRRVEMVKELGANCQVTPFLYITVFSYSTRTSVVACNHPLSSNQSPTCTTYNLIGERVR